MLSVGAAGCGAEAPGEAPERVAEAAAPLSAGFRVARSEGGTVADTQIVRRLGTPISLDPDANKNFGALDTAAVGTTSTSPKKSEKALIRVDLSFIPPGSTITSAELGAIISGAGITHVKRITAPWVESQVTYRSFNNAHASNDEATYEINPDWGDPQYAGFDVTNLVRSWYDGTYPNYGVALVKEDAPVTIATSETQDFPGPMLFLSYTTPDYCATAPACPQNRFCKNSAKGSFCTCGNGMTGENCDIPHAACPCSALGPWATGNTDWIDCSYSAYSATTDANIGEVFTSSVTFDPITGTGTCTLVNQMFQITDSLPVNEAEAEICREQILSLSLNPFFCDPF
ncbi:MAG: DNRLRE domain-containing protein [Byssovorax sp.]